MVIEAGVTDYWWKYQPDVVLGIDQFGESAPAKDLFDSLNISVETIVESVLVLLENNN
jgi:transketolase